MMLYLVFRFFKKIHLSPTLIMFALLNSLFLLLHALQFRAHSLSPQRKVIKVCDHSSHTQSHRARFHSSEKSLENDSSVRVWPFTARVDGFRRSFFVKTRVRV